MTLCVDSFIPRHLMNLSTRQSRYLRGLAHHLNPIVTVGKQGMTEALTKEVDRILADHELIKVRIVVDDRHALRDTAAGLSTAASAALVQVIGKIAVFYRPAETPEIKLPS